MNKLRVRKGDTLKKANILLITTDQQRKDTLGCYGNDLIRTPNIDRLAKEGMCLERAYCENPICIPSRVTMITGKSSSHHGAVLHNASMRDDERTIAHVLTESGYCTHFIGKPHFKSQGHSGTEESVLDWRKGLYDDWIGPYAGFQTVEEILGHCNTFYGHYGKWLRREHAGELKHFRDSNLRSLDITCGRGVYENHIPESVHSTAYVGDRACAFLEKTAAQDQPFFCFASFPDPHWPLLPPSRYFHMYDDVELFPVIPYNNEGNKDNYPAQFKMVEEGKALPYDGNGHRVKNVEDIDKIRRVYWGSISLIDHHVGRILNQLDELGLTEETLVIFTTDHGEYMGSHGLMAKGGFLWEDYVNLPFIVRYPGMIPGGTRTDALLSFVDIVPTLLDLVGLSNTGLAPDGVSQKEVWLGNCREIRNAVKIHHPTQNENSIPPDQYALITKKWKLVYYAGDGNGELYDLERDPNELSNLYNMPEYRQLQTTLTIQLLDEIILENDKQAIRQQQSGQEYKPFIMKYDVWKEEFDALK
jgi:arylsulfatase A-like enzyme